MSSQNLSLKNFKARLSSDSKGKQAKSRTKLTVKTSSQKSAELTLSSKDSSQDPAIVVRIEPPLSAKLAIKRSVADELQERLQNAGEEYNDSLESLKRVKSSLDDQEKDLFHSLQKIDKYVKEIHFLKREADSMHGKLKGSIKKYESKLDDLSDEFLAISEQRNGIGMLLEKFQPSKLHLDNIVKDLTHYSSATDLIEYYLTLETLQSDLLHEEKKRQREEDRTERLWHQTSERKRNHPLTIVAKENRIHQMNSQIDDLSLQNSELYRKIEIATLDREMDEIKWNRASKWIDELFQSTCEVIPLEHGESGETLYDRLYKIREFVTMSNKVVHKLKK